MLFRNFRKFTPIVCFVGNPQTSWVWKRNCFERESSYYPKAYLTCTSQSKIKIRIGFLINVGDGAVRENDFVRDYRVASPSISVREERDATTQCKTTNTNVSDATTNDQKVMFLEWFIDISPSGTSTDCCTRVCQPFIFSELSKV